MGNRLFNTPENSVNLWTTYKFQRGLLQGFGVGLGLFYVGERQPDLENTFTVPGYLRTDASIFYRWGQFRTALNVRNLFDIDYFEKGDSGSVYYGAPFSVEGTIRWEF